MGINLTELGERIMPLATYGTEPGILVGIHDL